MASDNTNVAPREQHSNSDCPIRFSNPIFYVKKPSSNPESGATSVFLSIATAKLPATLMWQNIFPIRGVSLSFLCASFDKLPWTSQLHSQVKLQTALPDPVFISLIHVSKQKILGISHFLEETPTQLVLHWNKKSTLPIINVPVAQKPEQTRVSLVSRWKGRGIKSALGRY